MCTASWLSPSAAGERLHLLFNRDELRRRAPAEPPRRAVTDGVAYLAPVDAASGGTWIAVSEAGLILALLNRNATRALPPAPRSRGTLIPALAGAADPAAAGRAFDALDLADLPPFTLIALAPGSGPVELRAWDGERRRAERLPLAAGLLCSSSLGDERADRERRPVWRRWRDGGERSVEGLRAFHQDHGSAPSAWSVCMHRDDARTVSFCEIEVTPERVAMRYQGGSPCEAADPAVAALDRLAAKSA